MGKGIPSGRHNTQKYNKPARIRAPVIQNKIDSGGAGRKDLYHAPLLCVSSPLDDQHLVLDGDKINFQKLFKLP